MDIAKFDINEKMGSRILFYTDPHLSDQTPISRVGDYRQDVLMKLQEILNLAMGYDVDWLVCGGDFFHAKSAWRVSHFIVNLVGQLFLAPGLQGMRRRCIIGNHDIPYGRLDLVERQPLGVLASWGAMEVPSEEFESDENVRFQYIHSDYRIEGDASRFVGESGDRVLVQVVHTMLLDSSQPAWPGGSLRFADYPEGEKVVLVGHVHQPQDVQIMNGNWFVAPGSVGRVDRSLQHHPQVAILDVDAKSRQVAIIYVKLKSAKPAFEVFIQSEALDEAMESMAIGMFVEDYLVGATVESRMTIDQIREKVYSWSIAEDLRDKVMSYIQEAHEEIHGS